jgi:hypothetical protein
VKIFITVGISSLFGFEPIVHNAGSRYHIRSGTMHVTGERQRPVLLITIAAMAWQPGSGSLAEEGLESSPSDLRTVV